MQNARLLLVLTLAPLAGCATNKVVDYRAPGLPEKVSAIWITRFDYKSPDDVKRIVNNCADAGFNTLVFQVRGHGTAHYRSEIEPWDDSLGGADPGWDPLQLAIDEAHARGVQVHAWVNAMPAWRGTKPPTNPNQLYNKHPEWFWYDQKGERQKLSSFYVSLNPCLPEVRQYVVGVCREIASRYAIDGLHLDYIRFPNEPPARPAGSGVDYPYDARTLGLYRAATGKGPDEDKAAWNDWRTEQVTAMVAEIRAMLRKTRPDAPLTASVGSVRKNALTHFQDAEAWLRRDLVHAVILMNYTASAEEFAKRLEPWQALRKEVSGRVIPGLSIGSHLRNKQADEVARDAGAQIETARSLTGDFCVFAYTYLYDSNDAELGSQGAAQSAERQKRREGLLPAIRGVSSAVK